MFQDSHAFSGFSSNDIPACRTFYADVLGVKVDDAMGGLYLTFAGGGRVYIYPKDNHEPATFTVLNFPVDDIDASVDQLVAKGVTLERYEGAHQDEKGIARSDSPEHGPSIAWFTDPAGNIISVLEGLTGK